MKYFLVKECEECGNRGKATEINAAQFYGYKNAIQIGSPRYKIQGGFVTEYLLCAHCMPVGKTVSFQRRFM